MTGRRWLGLAVLLAGCTARDETVPRLADGTLSARWTDSTAAAVRFKAPALGSWCEDRQELLVTAQRGDTGIAVVVAFGGPRASGRYAVRTDGTVPRSGVALRLADRTVLLAWRADSGSAEFTAFDGEAAGRFGARLVTVQPDAVAPTRVTGDFSGVPIVVDTACTPS